MCVPEFGEGVAGAGDMLYGKSESYVGASRTRRVASDFVTDRDNELLVGGNDQIDQHTHQKRHVLVS